MCAVRHECGVNVTVITEYVQRSHSLVQSLDDGAHSKVQEASYVVTPNPPDMCGNYGNQDRGTG